MSSAARKRSKASSSPHSWHSTSLGATGIIIGIPILLHFLFLACNDISGCPAPGLLCLRSLTWHTLKVQIPWPEDGIRGLGSWSVAAWVLTYYLVSLVLFRVLPAKEVLGTKLRESGKPLPYRFNGELPIYCCSKTLTAMAFSSTLIQLVPCAIGTYYCGSNFFLWVWIVDHYQQVLTANLERQTHQLILDSKSIEVYGLLPHLTWYIRP